MGTISAVDTPRYRCTACGNLTRFDVISTRRSRSFHHYSVGGELEVESVEVLAEENSHEWLLFRPRKTVDALEAFLTGSV